MKNSRKCTGERGGEEGGGEKGARESAREKEVERRGEEEVDGANVECKEERMKGM
jgi:hypothetical protein